MRRNPFRIDCSAGIRCLLLLLMGIAAFPAGAANEIGCDLICGKDEDCAVYFYLEGKQEAWEKGGYKRLPNCAAVEVRKGRVQPRYRRNGQPFSPPSPLPPSTRLQTAFDTYPPDKCSVITSSCLQRRMNERVAALGGHGMDSQKASPAGTGDPCSKGLPCGLVLPPTAQWAFRLEDAAQQGQLLLRVLRGTPPAGVPAEIALPVVNGLVQGDGRKFSAPAVYAYRLVGTGGEAVASGEFEILGPSRVSSLRGLANQRAAGSGLSEEAAWIDALGANQLDWDANQAMKPR